MPKRIYVGNLPAGTTEKELRQLFASYGEIQSVIIYDPTGSRSPGTKAIATDPGSVATDYAHIIMSDGTDIMNTINRLQYKTIGGKKLEIRLL